MSETKLGKIRKVRYGFGGYQDAMFGIGFDLDMKGSGVGDFWGMWPTSMWSERAQWTKEDAIREHGEIAMRLAKLMKEANVEDVKQLEGIPVEVTLDRNTLKSWRILTEVL